MSTQLQIRRDTAANIALSTPVPGELWYDTTNKRVNVGDGLNVGGIEIPNYIDIQNGTFNYALATGTANALVITTAPSNPTAYATGQRVLVKIATTNTGSTTINWGGLGVKTIRKWSSGTLIDLTGGELITSMLVTLDYDGTYFVIQSVGEATGRKLIRSMTLAGDATADFTSADLTGYSSYDFELLKVLPATDGADLRMRCSVAGVFSSATAYVTSGRQKSGTNASADFDLTTAYLQLTGTTGVGNASNEIGVDSKIWLPRPTVAGVKAFQHFTSYINSGNNPHDNRGRLSLTAAPFLVAGIDGVRFYFSSGNITSGTINLYGTP